MSVNSRTGVSRVRTQGKAISAFLEDSGHQEWSLRISKLIEDVDSPIYKNRALVELARLTHIQWLGDLSVNYGNSRSEWWKYLEQFERECRALIPEGFE